MSEITKTGIQRLDARREIVAIIRHNLDQSPMEIAGHILSLQILAVVDRKAELPNYVYGKEDLEKEGWIKEIK